MCDAAALGGLFAHLHSTAQIPSFLAAFESLRAAHVRALHDADMHNWRVFTMPPGAAHAARDAFLWEKHARGVDAFEGGDDDEVAVGWQVRGAYGRRGAR